MELNQAGITLSTPEKIREDLINRVTSKIPGFEGLPYELQQNLIDEAVQVIAYIEETIGTLFNSFSTDYATNPMFERLGNSFGIKKTPAIYSSVSVTFTGTAGTLIPEETEIKNADGSIKVYTQTQSIIPSTGSVVVFCASKDYSGEIPIGEMTVCENIFNVVVTNSTAGNAGLDGETESQFRSRVWDTIKGVRQGSLYAFRSRVLQVAGVDERKIRVVPVNYDEGGIGYRGLNVIVGGGDSAEVAAAIMDSFLETQKLRTEESTQNGKGTPETVSVTVYNDVFPVSFIRPAKCGLQVGIAFKIDFDTDLELLQNTITSAVTEKINSIFCGQPFSQIDFDNLVADTAVEFGVSRDAIGRISYDVKYQYNDTGGYQMASFDDLLRFTPAFDSFFIADSVSVKVTRNQ